MPDGLLHDARRLDDLGQEHLAGAEQVADDIHAGHQGSFDDIERALGCETGLLGVVDDKLVDAVDQRILEALRDLELAPGKILLFRGSPRFLVLVLLGYLEEFLRGIGRAIQHDVLDGVA